MSDAPAPPDRTRPFRPVRALVVVGGGVASGKSTLARALTRRLGARHVEADRVRNAVLVRDHTSERLASLDPGVEHEIYAELRELAEAGLASGRPVVVDACFPERADRDRVRALAHRYGCPFLYVECRTPPEAVRRRLAQRDRMGQVGGWQQIHDDLAARFEPVEVLDESEHRVVRGDGNTAEAVESVAAALEALQHARPERPAPSPPDVVTFDCWNTLLYEDDWEVAHALRVEALRAAVCEAGGDATREQAGRAFDAGWRRHMDEWRRGVATGAREVASDALRLLGLDDPRPAIDHLVGHFEEASHSSRVAVLDGAAEALAALCRNGIRCALICDTGLTPGRVVRRHLDRHGLLESLTVQIFSDEIGVPKPDRRAFLSALEPLEAEPERAWHVGDLRRTDVAGARAVGMTSVRIRGRHDDTGDLPEADFVVGSHGDLLTLVGIGS